MPSPDLLLFPWKRIRYLCLALAALTLAPQTLLSAEKALTQQAMELLRDECLRCHKPEKKKGGLLLHTREAAIKGGDTAPAVVPGNVVDSFLLEGLAADADPHMPPKKQLSKKNVDLLTSWIKKGAAWDEKTLAKITAPPVPLAKNLGTLPASYKPILAMAQSPDNLTLAAGSGGEIALYHFSYDDRKKKTTTGLKLKTKWPAHKDVIQSLAWSPDGKYLVSAAHREIQIRHKDQPKAQFTITQKLQGRITHLAITADSKFLLAADSTPSLNATIHVIDLASGKILHSIKNAHSDSIFDLVISPDKKHFTSVSADKLIKIWQLNSWKNIATLEGHTGFVLAAAYSPKGNRLATSGDDEVIKIWDITNKKQLVTFGSKQSGPVTGLLWGTDPAQVKKKAAEKDKKKAEKISTDKIFTISQDGRPRIYNNIVLHDGAQRSTGAREKAYNPQSESLASLLLVKPKEAPYPFLIAGSDAGSLLIWNFDGKLAFQQHPAEKITQAKKKAP